MIKFLTKLGLVWSWGIMIVLIITFYHAMANGGKTVVDVNSKGEMWLEAILIPIVFIISTWALVKTLRGLYETS